MMQRHDAFLAPLWAVVVACVGGCAENQRVQVFPVKGTLMVDGKPAAGAHIALHAIDSRLISRPVAITESDGTFEIMTYAAADGAPAGEYVVTVFWRDPSLPDDCGCHDHGDDPFEHDLLHGRYANAQTSQLHASIHSGSNQLLLEMNAEIQDVTIDAAKPDNVQLISPLDG